jgi:hypothetical protein
VSLPGVADGLSAKIKELLKQSGKGPALEGVNRQVERSVLEQRAYQRRMVLGGPHLRGSITMGQGGSGQAIPVYVREAIATDLPMMARFQGRILAEVHPQLDQGEAPRLALRGVAVARIFSLPADGRRA